jgi:xanthine dehydrogenase accessory factor
MIGSKRKTISIYKELEKEGIPAEKFANVHAPVGLEIGAVTPEEIAVAIVAEMIAERRHASQSVSSKKYAYPPSREEQDAVREETTKES